MKIVLRLAMAIAGMVPVLGIALTGEAAHGRSLRTLVARPPGTVSVARGRLVFERGFKTSHPSVWIARADGGGAHQLAAGMGPALSPDGRLVAYVVSPVPAQRRLMVVPASGGRPRRLLSTAMVFVSAWSADSKRVAVIEQTAAGHGSLGTIRLLTIDVASGRAHVLGEPALPYATSFSPDSRRLVYTRSVPGGTDLYVVPATGGRASRLTFGGHSMFPVWGPSSIVFVRTTGRSAIDGIPKQNLYVIRPSGVGLQRLTRVAIPKSMFGFTPIAWSANGRRLIAEWNGLNVNYVVTIDPRTGAVRRVGRPTRGKSGVGGVDLSRDGNTILGVQQDQTDNVVTLPYQGGQVRVLARDAIAPSWTR